MLQITHLLKWIECIFNDLKLDILPLTDNAHDIKPNIDIQVICTDKVVSSNNKRALLFF